MDGKLSPTKQTAKTSTTTRVRVPVRELHLKTDFEYPGMSIWKISDSNTADVVSAKRRDNSSAGCRCQFVLAVTCHEVTYGV